MNRRTFLRLSSGGTIAGLVSFGAFTSAIRSLGARLFRREPSYGGWNVGFAECLSSSTLHRIDTSSFRAWEFAASDQIGEIYISPGVIEDMKRAAT